LAGWSAVSVAQFLWHRFTADNIPPVNVQLAQLYERTADAGLRTVATRLVDLRGVGTPSRVLVLRKGGRRARFRGSDELRIYDIVGGRLRPSFRFRPRLTARPLALRRYIPGHGFKIELRNVFDANATG